MVCPVPTVWMELHKRLCQAAKVSPNVPQPPTPLILNGWVYTNDAEKKARWDETLQWATQYGFRTIIGDLQDEEVYTVEELTRYEIGPLGGPMHLPWNFAPKPLLSADDRERALRILQENWMTIVGRELGVTTKPIKISGAKGRRLIVAVRTSGLPPWGSWTALAFDDRRRSFTVFRAAINRAISPAEVDHIDFIQESKRDES